MRDVVKASCERLYATLGRPTRCRAATSSVMPPNDGRGCDYHPLCWVGCDRAH
jgi:hypothetical protein